MACGAPAVVSNVASLPEVVGDAGILLDPHDPPAWTEAMRRLAEDPTWREARINASREQVARFSWERCAQQTVRSYWAAANVPP
jgi:glycosyltransferase involved in cell wall biosynthesis